MAKRLLGTGVLAVVLAVCLWQPSSAQQPANVSQMNGVTVLMGAGNTGTGSQRVTEATDSHLSTTLDTISTNIADGVATNSIKHFVSAGATEDETQIKATPGVLAGVSVTNNHATTDAFFRCVNKTSANTTPGSETIFYGVMVPHLGGVVDRGIEAAFSVALTCYVVTGEAENDVAEVAANDISVNVTYR